MNRVKIGALVTAGLVVVSLPLLLRAALLGVEPGFPLLAFDHSPNGGVTYSAGSQDLTVVGTTVAARFGSAEQPRPVTGPNRAWTVHVKVNSAGGLIGGVAGNDLVINGQIDQNGDSVVDFGSPLLTGEVLDFGAFDSGGPTDQYDFRFAITGGSMASVYGEHDTFVVKVSSENSSFGGDFRMNFSGRAKGNGGSDCEDQSPPDVRCDAEPLCTDDKSDDDDASSDDDSDNDLASDDDDESSDDNSECGGCDDDQSDDDDPSSDDDSDNDLASDDDDASSDDRSECDQANYSLTASKRGALLTDNDQGRLFRITFSATDDCRLVSLEGEIDIGCDTIPVEDGQLVLVYCSGNGDERSDDDDPSSGDNSDEDFASDDGDRSSDDNSDCGSDDDDPSSDDDSDNDFTSDDDDGSSEDNSDECPGECSYEFDGDVLVIRSGTAVLIVTAVDGEGNESTCMVDLCAKK